MKKIVRLLLIGLGLMVAASLFASASEAACGRASRVERRQERRATAARVITAPVRWLFQGGSGLRGGSGGSYNCN
jgi:hypothetical protein